MPETKRRTLDRTDRLILRELQADGRLTNIELSRRIGLTAPPTLRRMRALEDAGVIRGIHADVDPVIAGWPVMVFATVSLANQAPSALRAFEEHVAALGPVRECHMLNGETDFLLKIMAPDLPSFQEFLVRHLLTAPGVASVRTSMTIRTSKEAPGPPLDD